MASISCRTGQCIATGGGRSSLNRPQEPQAWTLSKGRWSVVSLPGGTTTRQTLESVSCSQPNSCVAVGWTQVGAASKGFAERLVSGVWLQTPLPSGTPQLYSVSCLSRTWCMAVGSAKQQPESNIALEWNGTTWRQITTAAVTPSEFYGVSCLSSTFCMAVGYSGASPLAEEWNGTSWTNTSPPANPPPVGGKALAAVSCTSASFCLAVGFNAGGTRGGIVMSWHGSRWAVPKVSSKLSSAVWGGVSCTSATWCLVAGDVSPANTQNFLHYPVIGRWNGTSLAALGFTRVGRESALGAVSCTRARWCAVVGSYTTRDGAQDPLIERWDGVTIDRMWAPL